MMRQEVVGRRGWMGDQEFLDLNGATNLIPGPNSTELAIHIGRERAGWRGLLVAGICFIVPATLIVLAFAIAYGAYGSSPAGQSLLYLFASVPEIPLLFGAALLVFAAENAGRWWGKAASVAPLGVPMGLLAGAKAPVVGGALSIFWSFLKIGSVLSGLLDGVNVASLALMDRSSVRVLG
jgi:chromate transporter